MYSKNNLFAPDYADHVKVRTVKAIRAFDGLTDSEVEHKLLTMVGSDILPGIEVPKVKLKEEVAKWRVISALQKAIRRGDAPLAVRCAVAVDNYDTKYLWRRLTIIAFEDGGIPMLPLTAFICSIAGKTEYRKKLGGQKVLCYVVDQMARGYKDRTFCELANAGHFNSPESLKKWLFDATVDREKVLAEFQDDKHPVWEQYTIGRALAGALKHQKDGDGGTKYNEYAPPYREGLFRVVYQMKLPRLVQYATRRGVSLGAESLSVAAPLVWPYFENGKDAKTGYVQHEMCECEMIGTLPSVAYDKHTLEGKKAIAYFIKACNPVAGWLEKYFPGDRMRFVGSALFYIEGGNVLNKSLAYPGWYEIFKVSMEGEAKFYGLTYKKMIEFYHLVGDNLPILNKARKIMCGVQ